jgi:hypothetical protein
MQDLITLYTPELLKAFVAITALLFGANILQAIAAINRRNALTEAEEGKRAAMEMLKQATDKAKKVQSERDMANELRDRIERAAKVVESDRDSWKRTAENLLTERATLYFRNAKGQIEPITPKERKPHTLKHGMTVKEPTQYQAKRIFAAAKRAGITVSDSMPDECYPWIHYTNEHIQTCTDCDEVNDIYISAREFLRRIKGEIE